MLGRLAPFADNMSESIIKQIADGRTDLVFDYLAAGHPATSADKDGTSLIKWCAYYGDVSAIRFLLANGESLQSLGDSLDLHAPAFHGHWRLCQFLIEQGADVNKPLTIRESRHCTQLYAILTGCPMTSCSKCSSAMERIPTLLPSHPLKRVASCATAEQKVKHLCTVRRPLALKKRSRCCWMRGQALRRK